MNQFTKSRLANMSIRARLLLSITLLAFVSMGVWSVESAIAARSAAPVEQTSPVHPTFALLDSDGENVLTSNAALSLDKTCGTCHDTAFIASHAFHADLGLSGITEAGQAATGTPWDTSTGLFGQFDPLTYRYLTPAGDERLDLSTAGWLEAVGSRIVGGGPAMTSREGQPLLSSTLSGPEASILDPVTGQSSPWDWSRSGVMEMNCLLCHTVEPNNAARIERLQAGQFGDAVTATLLGTGIVDSTDQGWAWNADAFDATGELKPEFVRIQDPTNENCAQCHGVVHDGATPLTLEACDLDNPQTATTGQVISGQKISESGLNLADKGKLTYAWDIHAERGLKCTDCHYSLNNPIHYQERQDDKLPNLLYDPRRLEIGEYIERPDHTLARGQSAQFDVAPESKATMRRCESCHDAVPTHQDWLPYTERHMQEVACETCHVPELHAPAIQSSDWTVIKQDGSPVTVCRGIDGDSTVTDLVTGFKPVLMQRTNVDGQSMLAPYNLITSWFWIYDDANGNTRPVRQIDLETAYLQNGAYRTEIIAAFDSNGDGVLADDELTIDGDASKQAVTEQLAALGLGNPRIYGQVQPYSINHDVVRGKEAISDCQTCHTDKSSLVAPIVLAGSVPGGVLPQFVADVNVAATGVLDMNAGKLTYQPDPQADDIYIFGNNRVTLIDWLGALVFLTTLLIIAVHATMRVLAARRNPKEPVATQPVYMYDKYERFWHWLQTITIILLLLTGMVIHRPAMFGMFSFRHMVTLHNALAVVLIANAALALFWHLTSGQIHQFLPRPRGFFDQAIVQAKFYLSGIFNDGQHPFSKTYRQKLNPLQQISYFGLLNVLLPFQIITGALMWGVQQWPGIAAMMGGLPYLAPFHTLIAWLLATFVVAHVYLTTTGESVEGDIRAMITGWENVPVHEEHTTQ
ncbi:MAG: cytochrome b/b6 domain-containing protein [Anaerolineae bacterium]|nr:cytochrome b/b6 domain-containing protein [Anaerolineae bacterium]